MNKISAVYKIVNKITGECYIGSSKDVMKRWASHRCPSRWKQYPNNKLYKDFQKFGLDKFDFQILCPVMPEYLTQVEQELIEMLQPTYNNYNAKGWDIERIKETRRRYSQSDEGKEAHRKSSKKYSQSDKGKEYHRKYQQSDKYKEVHRKASIKYLQSDKGKESNRKSARRYQNQLCFYNGETLTLRALSLRFFKKGMKNPVLEAKKYLL